MSDKKITQPLAPEKPTEPIPQPWIGIKTNIGKKKARAEKELEEKMKQQKAEYELFTLEFGVQSDSEYETD
ncbi:hypothetical protein Tco_0343644 [Tanacetum coccineum]